MHRTSRNRTLFLIFLIVLSPGAVDAQAGQAQTWHPMLKERWGDSDTWRIITPRDLDVNPRKFAGLRVQYRVSEGLTDPLIQDGVFQFQPAARNGVQVIVGSYITLGNIDVADLGPGWWNGVIEPRSLAMLDFVSAAPSRFGSFMYRPTESGTMRWRLERDADQWSAPTLVEHDEPVFHLAIWGQILAAMDLREGMKFRLAVLQGLNVGYVAHYVAGRTTIEDLDGRQHEVWAVETPEGRSGWVGTYYVSDQAPFYFGFDARNVESGDVRRSWRLRHFEWLSAR